jgi:small subunit ribosomal protein S17
MAEEQTPEDEITTDTPPEAETPDAAQTEASVSEGDPASGETPGEAPAAPASAPAEVVAPKERRRRARAEKAAGVPTRSQTSPEERQAEREAERKRKASVRTRTRRRSREKARSKRGETPEPLAPRREQHPGQQKTRQGVVVSDRANKTIIVRIDVTRRHRSYGKVVRTSTTLHAHDEREDAHIGDTVVVRESRPLSRTKRWRLVEVVERAE